jgi:hypothetical protein
MADKVRDHIGFTLDFERVGNLAAQDPQTLKDLVRGIQAAQSDPLPQTTALGAANLTPGEGREPTWCSIFFATVRDKKPGEEGLFYRNNTHGGDGKRVQMRMRRQPKRDGQRAVSPGEALPAEGNATSQLIAQVTEAVMAQLNAASAPAKGVELPDDIADIVNV